MKDLRQILHTAAHHLLVRIETIDRPDRSEPDCHDQTTRVVGLVADVIRSRQCDRQPAVETGDQLTFYIPGCRDELADMPADQGSPSVSEMVQLRGLYEVVLDEEFSVIENLIEQVDDQPEDPRYSEFGAFHG